MQQQKMIDDAVRYLGAGWIRTTHGKFNLEAPTFDLRDIAHSLAMLCRFNGHVSDYHSVAEHSVTVSRIMEIDGGDPKEGLLHDATEAYLSDVPAPFKQFLPDWRGIDQRLETLVRAHYDLPGVKTPECHRADRLALFIEAFYLIPGRGEDFMDQDGLREQALALLRKYPTLAPRCLDHRAAEGQFMERVSQVC